jgi:hypothetical protein
MVKTSLCAAKATLESIPVTFERIGRSTQSVFKRQVLQITVGHCINTGSMVKITTTESLYIQHFFVCDQIVSTDWTHANTTVALAHQQ